MSKDKEVQKAFAASQTAFDSYYNNEVSYIDTADIFETMMTKYMDFLVGISKAKTVADYDAMTGDITGYLNQHPTVPLKEFNDNFYVSYRQDILDYLSASHDYLGALQAGDLVQFSNAYTSMITIAQKVEALGVKAQASKPYTPGDPTSQLNDLKQTLSNRKATFWR